MLVSSHLSLPLMHARTHIKHTKWVQCMNDMDNQKQLVVGIAYLLETAQRRQQNNVSKQWKTPVNGASISEYR